ncbi:MAG: cyanophycin synthetase, partial [Hydrogenophaga sp.]|nr:cyanophycin synthetase [Hydrogenophaga sp.]
MQVSRIRALRGPNLWSRHTAMEAIVTCTPEGSGLSAQHPIEQQLRRILPEVGPFDGQRPGEAATLAHALEKVTLSLQIHAGCPVSFSRTTPTEEPGV